MCAALALTCAEPLSVIADTMVRVLSWCSMIRLLVRFRRCHTTDQQTDQQDTHRISHLSPPLA